MVGLTIMISLVGTRCTPGLIDGISFWATTAFRLNASDCRTAPCWPGGNRSRMRSIVLYGVRSVDRPEHDVPGLGRVDGGLERVRVAHLAHQDHVRVFADRVLEGRVPVHTSR